MILPPPRFMVADVCLLADLAGGTCVVCIGRTLESLCGWQALNSDHEAGT